ncbi:MAG: hypothetical protein PHF05_01355 [Candidatus Izemoplasmatales bacterium]|nr:hypothetical protein [Candidatus Izemoplasmatales bacterium]MDY0138161.1 hypothetical protein [Candidatus Izemoplasmatales bacterium]
MKNFKRKTITIFTALLMIIGLTACNSKTTSSTTEGTNTPDATTTTNSSTSTTDQPISYYLAGNFSGYIANEQDFLMEEVENNPGWYQITVSLTADNRDNAYDGHYYKVTDGTWTNCWGTDNYALQPVPASPTGGGLGSIWIYDNQDLTVLFDSETRTIYDSSMERTLSNPVIYGDFSNWSLSDERALVLTQSTTDEKLFVGELTLPAYTGTSEEGYSLAVCLSEKYYIWAGSGSWGAGEQYLFDGSAAAMGVISHLKPTEETTYQFTFNSETNITTVVVELDNPVIYGDFSGWSLDPNDAIELIQDSEDENLYIGTYTMPAYAGQDKGYMLSLATSLQLYFWQGVGSWGASEQYLFSGDSGGMGKVTYLNISESMELTFTYNKTTNVTTITPPTGKTVAPFEMLSGPTLYGTFTRITDDSECFILEGEGAAVMTLVSGETDLYEITLSLNIYESPTSGYYTADEGYRFIVVLTKSDVGWGYYAGEQYLFDGSPATMGASTIVNITETGNYHFIYNSTTNETTYSKVE